MEVWLPVSIPSTMMGIFLLSVVSIPSPTKPALRFYHQGNSINIKLFPGTRDLIPNPVSTVMHVFTSPFHAQEPTRFLLLVSWWFTAFKRLNMTSLSPPPSMGILFPLWNLIHFGYSLKCVWDCSETVCNHSLLSSISMCSLAVDSCFISNITQIKFNTVLYKKIEQSPTFLYHYLVPPLGI